jgi:hypothetical protein
LVVGAEGAEVSLLDEVFGTGFVADEATGNRIDEVHERESFNLEEAAFFFGWNRRGGRRGGRRRYVWALPVLSVIRRSGWLGRRAGRFASHGFWFPWANE